MNASRRTSSRLTLTLLAGVAIGSVTVAMPQARAEVGVAAAVNTDARGQAPGAAPRVLALGQKVVFNERISTDASGQAQILLLDGTTFTVGPNSDLAIDEFVFNPETGSAKVVASVTKGAFRFIGAKTSQSPDGVTINTQVGTIGVRGGSLVCGMSGGQFVCMMPFGKSVNIQSKDGSTHTIFKSGWLLAFDENGNFIEERKAKPQEVGIITAALNGKGNGGTSSPPDDGTVQGSEVPTTNSQLPNTIPVSVLMEAVKSNPRTETIVDNKAQDDIDQDIDENPPGPTTFAARLLTSPDTYTGYDDLEYPNAGSRGLVGSTPETDQTVFFQRLDGRLIANGPGVDINLPDFTGTLGDDAQTNGLYTYSMSSEDGAFSGEAGLRGVVYAGVGDFAAYMLNHEGDLEDPFYLITGTPTSQSTFEDMEAGSNIRRYTLTNDQIRSTVPVPFFANDVYNGTFVGGPTGNYGSTDLLVIEPGQSENPDIRAFQSWVHIQGTGPTQKSAAMVFTGTLWSDPNTGGEYVLSGGRRGTFQRNGTLSTVNMRGGIESTGGAQSNLPNGTGGHIFGANANHFVIGQPIGTEPDRYGDAPLNPSGYFTNNPNAGYIGDGNFGTHHVANLVSETAPASGSRTSRDLEGYMVGMGASDLNGDRYLLANGSDEGGPQRNLVLKLSATENSVYAQSRVVDFNDSDSVVASMLLTFGSESSDPGTNAFIDNNNYGARRANNQSLTQLETDGGDTFNNIQGATAGSYLVSGRTNPIEGYVHCTQCSFVEWGWWGTQVAVQGGDPEDLNEDEIEGDRRDQVHMGTWVAGTPTDPAGLQSTNDINLPFGGVASYTGTAIGTVDNNGSQYIATGEANMIYRFATREGDFELDFDGRSVAGSVTDDFYSPTGKFSGNLNGDAYGIVSGSFVDDPSNQSDPRAAGAIGSFTLDNDSNYRAVGTFVTIGNAPL